jgi:hypothetical protein
MVRELLSSTEAKGQNSQLTINGSGGFNLAVARCGRGYGASIQVKQVFTDSYTLRDRLIRLGSGTKKTPFITLRLIEVRSGKTWHSYLTSVLDPTILPPYLVADLDRRRWRIIVAATQREKRSLKSAEQIGLRVGKVINRKGVGKFLEIQHI